MSLMYTVWNPTEAVVQTHLDAWGSYSEKTRQQFEVIWVDDCSDQPVKLEVPFPMNLTIARITDDIYWNICGAKNLGMHLAQGPWVFASEQDHFFQSEEDVLHAIAMEKERGTVYSLKRFRPWTITGSQHKSHPNTFIIHKEDFEVLGGYDEDFSGHRGHSDEMIREAMRRHGFKTPVADVNLTAHVEFSCNDPQQNTSDPDSVATNRAFNRALVQKKMAQLRNGKYQVGPRLRFDWEITQELRYA